MSFAFGAAYYWMHVNSAELAAGFNKNQIKELPLDWGADQPLEKRQSNSLAYVSAAFLDQDGFGAGEITDDLFVAAHHFPGRAVQRFELLEFPSGAVHKMHYARSFDVIAELIDDRTAVILLARRACHFLEPCERLALRAVLGALCDARHAQRNDDPDSHVTGSDASLLSALQAPESR